MPTRTQFEAEMVDRAGPLMAAVGMAVTTEGSNASLNGPLRFALSTLNLIPANDPVQDSDLESLDSDRVEDLYDLGEYRVLKTVRNRWTKVRIQVGPNALYESDILASLDRRLKELSDEMKQRFGIGLASLVGGSITLTGLYASEDDEDAIE